MAINFTFFSKKCHLIDIIIVTEINFHAPMLITWYSEALARHSGFTFYTGSII